MGETVSGDGKHIRGNTNTQKKWGSLERCLRGDGLTYGQQTTALGGAGCVCVRVGRLNGLTVGEDE